MNAVEWLREIPRKHADREFLVDTISGQRLTFAELDANATRVAADLRRRGIGKGDRVLTLLNNSKAFVELYFGCLYAGAVAVPINPILSAKEVDYILRHAHAKLAIVSAETAPHVGPTLSPPDGCGFLLLNDEWGSAEPPADVPAWDFSRLPEANGFVPMEGASPQETMAIVFTSGTTGRPSGVVHRIEDLVDNARTFNRRLGIGPENRFYGILAMAYLGGYYNLLLLPYVAGASVVLGRAFDARAALRFWKPAQEHGVNTLWLVPTIIAILMEMDRGREGEEFCRQQVRLALTGTAPLPTSLRKSFEARYGVELHENFGLSETLFISTNSPDVPVLDGCVGRLLPNVQATVKGPDGKPLDYGQEGEIVVSTPYLMEGYYDPQSRQVDRLERDAWFPTGDVGILTATGDLYITGRKKDLIIRGGINISPAQIEEVLYRHEAVTQCAAVGVYHPIYGEEIAVAVRLQEGHSFADTRDELTTLLKSSLGPIKQPAHLIEIDQFPLSSTGKIQKAKVRVMLEHKLGIARPEEGQTRATPKLPEAPAMIPGRARRTFPRPARELIEQLRPFPTSTVSDSMNRLGMMDASIHALVRGRPFCGPAFTVEEVEAGNMMSHLALEWVEAGDVLVVDAKGVTTRACWGGLQTLMAKKRGAAAIVLNGMIRDYEDVLQLEIPVYALGTSPGGPLKGWGGNLNHPVACGGVAVNPGDVVIGDDDGVVVVPADLVEPVLECCRQRAAKEKLWFEQVEAGQSTLDAVGLRSKLEQIPIRFE